MADKGSAERRGELVDASSRDQNASDATFFTATVMAMDDALRQLPASTDPSADGFEAPGVVVPRTPRRPQPRSGIAVPEPDV